MTFATRTLIGHCVVRVKIKRQTKADHSFDIAGDEKKEGCSSFQQHQSISLT